MKMILHALSKSKIVLCRGIPGVAIQGRAEEKMS